MVVCSEHFTRHVELGALPNTTAKETVLAQFPSLGRSGHWCGYRVGGLLRGLACAVTYQSPPDFTE